MALRVGGGLNEMDRVNLPMNVRFLLRKSQEAVSYVLQCVFACATA